MDQPVIPEGQEAGVTEDSRAINPDVWAQGLPSRVPVLGTLALVQEPGKGPHRPALEEATKRVRLTMPTGQVAGMVPVRALDPRLSWVRAPRALQAEGRVPVRWLLAMVRKVRRERADQEEGRDPTKELPASATD